MENGVDWYYHSYYMKNSEEELILYHQESNQDYVFRFLFFGKMPWPLPPITVYQNLPASSGTTTAEASAAKTATKASSETAAAKTTASASSEASTAATHIA